MILLVCAFVGSAPAFVTIWFLHTQTADKPTYAFLTPLLTCVYVFIIGLFVVEVLINDTDPKQKEIATVIKRASLVIVGVASLMMFYLIYKHGMDFFSPYDHFLPRLPNRS